MSRIGLLIESTRSRRGKHLARSVAVILKSDGRLVTVKPQERSRGTYSKGEAAYAQIDLEKGDVVVWIKLVRNFMGRVKGVIVVYDDKGREVLRLVYKRFKIRRSRGDPSYWVYVERVLKALKLYDRVRKVNLNTGVA